MLLVVSVALSCLAEACTFKAPDANKPLGCACNPRPNAYAYCKYDACNFAGCRSGFFDLDGQPSNGCEADIPQLPGNLVFALNPGSYARWYSESDNDSFRGLQGTATATVANPACQPSADQRCDFRLEAFQMSLIADTTSRPPQVVIDDVIVGTTKPLTGSNTGAGVNLTDPSAFSASFGKDGSRAPIVSATGWLSVQINTSIDGRVRISLFGNFDGYVDDLKGNLTFLAFGNTPQLFDASVPDAQARDAATDGNDASNGGLDDAAGSEAGSDDQ